MMLLKFCLYAMIMSGCNNTNDTTIIGKAENAKAGAIVTSNKDQKIYYLDKINFWESSIVGKTVRVTGKLMIEEKKPVQSGEDIPQQLVGVKRILIKPKWELME